MYINEGVNKKYCYASESIWDKSHKKYSTPSKCIGHLDTDKSFIPNLYLSQLFYLESSDPSSLNENERLIIKTVINKYGDDIRIKAERFSLKQLSGDNLMTATAVFIGPDLVFSEITKRYRIGFLLEPV
jgi:hypothetical protein